MALNSQYLKWFLKTRRSPCKVLNLKVWNFARGNQVSDGSGLKIYSNPWNVYCW